MPRKSSSSGRGKRYVKVVEESIPPESDPEDTLEEMVNRFASAVAREASSGPESLEGENVSHVNVGSGSQPDEERFHTSEGAEEQDSQTPQSQDDSPAVKFVVELPTLDELEREEYELLPGFDLVRRVVKPIIWEGSVRYEVRFQDGHKDIVGTSPLLCSHSNQ